MKESQKQSSKEKLILVNIDKILKLIRNLIIKLRDYFFQLLKQKNFAFFVICCFLFLYFDISLNREVISSEGDNVGIKITKFLFDLFPIIMRFDQKYIELINNIVKQILEYRIGSLFSCSLFSTIIAEVIKKYFGDSSVKIYGITPKSYQLYYNRIWKIRFTIAILFISFICNAHFTLLFIIIAFLLYILNILFLSVYSQQVKTGIKNGYFRYVKENKSSKEYGFIGRQMHLLKKAFYGDRPANLEKECESLIERLVVYSLDSNSKKEKLENFDVLKFTVEIMSELFAKVDDKVIFFYIQQLQKSINSFFVFEKVNDSSLDFYLKSTLRYVLSTDKDKSKKFKKYVFLSLFLIIFEVSTLNNDDKQEYLLLIKRNINSQMSEEWSEIITSIYIIFFFRQINDDDILDEYILFKNCLEDNSLDEKLILDKTKMKNVYNMSRVVVSCLYNYPDDFIDRFQNQYIFIVRYIDDDLINSLFRYIEEVV